MDISRRLPEVELYEPVKEYLNRILRQSFSSYHLEITARRSFSEGLKHLLRYDITFAFLRMAPPDLVGFVLKEGIHGRIASRSDVSSFITVEVKPGKIRLQDIYQAKMYGDLFYAKYALLVSPETIGEEIRRLHEKLSILSRFRGWKVYVGQLYIERRRRSIIEVTDCIWFPETPF